MLTQGITSHARQEASSDIITHLKLNTDPMTFNTLFRCFIVNTNQHIGLFRSVIDRCALAAILDFPATSLADIMVIVCVIPQHVNIQQAGMVIGSHIQAGNIVIPAQDHRE